MVGWVFLKALPPLPSSLLATCLLSRHKYLPSPHGIPRPNWERAREGGGEFVDRHVFHFLFSFGREKEKSTSKKLSPPLPDYILALYSRGTFVPSQEKELTSASSSHKSAKKNLQGKGGGGEENGRTEFISSSSSSSGRKKETSSFPCCHLQRRRREEKDHFARAQILVSEIDFLPHSLFRRRASSWRKSFSSPLSAAAATFAI